MKIASLIVLSIVVAIGAVLFGDPERPICGAVFVLDNSRCDPNLKDSVK
jgi:hypothetical protein